MSCWQEWKPVAVMLAVDVAFAVMNIMIKVAIDDGMNKLVFITLRLLVATIFLAPFAYFHERKTRPKLTAEICIYLFFSAILGASVTQYLFFLGLQYVSATFACAFLNMTPVLTFLIALALRYESLNLKSTAGVAKVLGTSVCFAGVMVLTFYKGSNLNNTSHQPFILHQESAHSTHYSSRDWFLGTIALIAASVSWSSWFPLQSKVGKMYPALYSGTALTFFISFLQAGALTLATQRGLSVWIFTKKLQIVTVLFAGIVGSGLGFLAMSWCVEQRGPVFTVAFTPLIQITVAVIEFTILHEPIHLGSVLGSILVIVGLYFLLWGKVKEVHSCVVKPAEGIATKSQEQVEIV